MSKEIIQSRLKTAREAIGITKAEAARRLNLSKIGYCRYEYGDRVPSIQTLEVIAICFGTTVAFLTGKTDDIAPDYMVIRQEESPELYEIATIYGDITPDMQKRLLTYAKKLQKK